MNYGRLGALSCPEQCETGCTEKFGAAGYPHDECVKACLAICPGGGAGAGGASDKGAFLVATVMFAGLAAVGALVYYTVKK